MRSIKPLSLPYNCFLCDALITLLSLAPSFPSPHIHTYSHFHITKHIDIHIHCDFRFTYKWCESSKGPQESEKITSSMNIYTHSGRLFLLSSFSSLPFISIAVHNWMHWSKQPPVTVSHYCHSRKIVKAINVFTRVTRGLFKGEKAFKITLAIASLTGACNWTVSWVFFTNESETISYTWNDEWAG